MASLFHSLLQAESQTYILRKLFARSVTWIETALFIVGHVFRSSGLQLTTPELLRQHLRNS